MSSSKRVLILDTSAFIMGYNPFSITEQQYTVPKVFDEIAPDTTIWLRFKLAVETGKLTVKPPSPLYIDKISELSAKIGDYRLLSDVDKNLLALALELKEAKLHPVMVTDDYSIQNVAARLNLRYIPLATFGIRYRFQWLLYCPACHRKYPQDWPSENCKVCGTVLKRKVLKKFPIKRKSKPTQNEKSS